MDAGGSVQISQSQSAAVENGILVHETSPESLGNARGSGQNFVSQGNETFRESLGDAGGSDQLDAGGSVQISQSQSAVSGDGILVNETSPESLGNAGGSGQNCASKDNETFRESLRDAGGSDQLDTRGSDENLYGEVDADKSPKLPLKIRGNKKINALQSDDEDSRFSARSAEII